MYLSPVNIYHYRKYSYIKNTVDDSIYTYICPRKYNSDLSMFLNKKNDNYVSICIGNAKEYRYDKKNKVSLYLYGRYSMYHEFAHLLD